MIREETYMNPPWSIAVWYKIDLDPLLTTDKGIIVSYEGIYVFLTIDKHIIGINDGNFEYLGPVVTGLEDSPWILYGLNNDGSHIVLFLNGEKVLEVSHGKLVFTTEQFHAKKSKSPPLIIKEDLSNWVDKRESMFKIKQETSNHYRLQTPDEQVQQLVARMDALKDLLKGYHSGKRFYLADILANLRSLIFYKDKSHTYDPLLLRVAAIKHSPLPVYVAPESDKRQQLTEIPQPTIDLFDFVSFEPVIPYIKRIDFQDFLENPSLFYEGQKVSPLALIEMISTTQSTAHFDQRVCKIADALDDTPVTSGHNTLEFIIISLAEIVVNLGDFVFHS